ncbi:MAG TPA: glycosyltransferase family 39 protein [Thermoanaerobaculia bacterium]|nr:glycosyltransferase family 39 protein [Thermoanaerobaculia bacterium]
MKAPPADRGGAGRATLGTVLVLGLALLPRLPLLLNATARFGSDEAVDALVILHLLSGRELALHNWTANYYGIVEGLLAVPFIPCFGATALAFELGALAGFMLLVWGVWALGRRLYGRTAGAAGAALLCVFSPQVLLWSVTASGGYALVAAWGTLLLLYYDRVRISPRRGQLLALGWMAGFGLYIYELFLVYLATLALGWALRGWPRRLLAARTRRQLREALAELPLQLEGVSLLLLGFLAGFLPRLWAILAGGADRPRYAFAVAGQISANLWLLLARCAPALLGINPPGTQTLDMWVGPRLGAGLPSLLILAFYTGAWLFAGWSAWRQPAPGPPPDAAPAEAAQQAPGEAARQAPADDRRAMGPSTQLLLVLLIPVSALLFVLSPNPVNATSNRYLLPWLTSLGPLGGFALTRLARRGRRVAWAAGTLAVLLLVGVPAAQSVLWEQEQGVLDPDLLPRRLANPLGDALAYLRGHGFSGAYGGYWIAYKLTFESRERVVVAPYEDWDRYPPYARYVDSLPVDAYLWDPQDPLPGELDALYSSMRQSYLAFMSDLSASGRRWKVVRFGRMLLYVPAGRYRLLPPQPRPLARLAAALEITPPAAPLAPGERLRLGARITNLGEDAWSAAGGQGGRNRVVVDCRIVDGRGSELLRAPPVALPGPVLPGAQARLILPLTAPERTGRYAALCAPAQQEGGPAALRDGVGAAVVAIEVK